jgi:inner membrane transporter RhtA
LNNRQPLTSGGIVLAAIVSVQIGAALATTLFDQLGPGGAVLLRSLFAAVALVAVWRPSVRGHTRREWRLVVAYAVALSAMNLSFYAALDRIPLGIAVTFEFVGPLGIAVAGSRRGRDLLWVALAGAGIALLSPGIGGSLDALGVFYALLAGVFWGAYILITSRLGRAFERGDGLALAMSLSALFLLPSGIAAGGANLLAAGLLATGLAVGLLSSAIPYSLELEALRRLPESTFGVLMSLEPAVAAISGFVFLGQDLAPRELAAIAFVIAASAGALGTAAARTPAPVEA